MFQEKTAQQSLMFRPQSTPLLHTWKPARNSASSISTYSHGLVRSAATASSTSGKLRLLIKNRSNLCCIALSRTCRAGHLTSILAPTSTSNITTACLADVLILRLAIPPLAGSVREVLRLTLWGLGQVLPVQHANTFQPVLGVFYSGSPRE